MAQLREKPTSTLTRSSGLLAVLHDAFRGAGFAARITAETSAFGSLVGLTSAGLTAPPRAAAGQADLALDAAALAEVSAEQSAVGCVFQGHTLRRRVRYFGFLSLARTPTSGSMSRRRIDVLLERYIRPAQALQTTSSRDLGL